jgi:hypothetical protein
MTAPEGGELVKTVAASSSPKFNKLMGKFFTRVIAV